MHIKNLQTIFEQNRLGKTYIVAKNLSTIQNFKTSNSIPIFKDRFISLPSIPIVNNRHLFSITSGKTKSLLKEDFELRASWRLLRGKGTVSPFAQEKVSGDAALLIKTDSGVSVTARVANNLSIDRHHLVILLWTGKNLGPSQKDLILPGIYLEPIGQGVKGTVKLAPINSGNSVSLRNWPLLPFMGIIPPGTYNIDIRLTAAPKQKILIDGIRVFASPITERF